MNENQKIGNEQTQDQIDLLALLNAAMQARLDLEKQIADARGFFRDYSGSARTKIRNYSDNVDYHLWMNRLVDDTTLAKLECNKQYSVYDSSNADEYEYRPGWNQAKNAEKRYCGSKHYDPAAEVLTTYAIQIRNEPTYDLIDTSTNAVVEFSHT